MFRNAAVFLPAGAMNAMIYLKEQQDEKKEVL